MRSFWAAKVQNQISGTNIRGFVLIEMILKRAKITHLWLSLSNKQTNKSVKYQCNEKNAHFTNHSSDKWHTNILQLRQAPTLLIDSPTEKNISWFI